MNLHKSLIILPTDYNDFGGCVKRWENPNLQYPDCSECKHFASLRESLGNDWGVCTNLKGPRKGLLTWQYMAGFGCFESKEKNDE